MAEDLIVQTNYGFVQGKHRVGLNGVKFVSFQRIRYARPPLGELRFKVILITTKCLRIDLTYWCVFVGPARA